MAEVARAPTRYRKPGPRSGTGADPKPLGIQAQAQKMVRARSATPTRSPCSTPSSHPPSRTPSRTPSRSTPPTKSSTNPFQSNNPFLKQTPGPAVDLFADFDFGQNNTHQNQMYNHNNGSSMSDGWSFDSNSSQQQQQHHHHYRNANGKSLGKPMGRSPDKPHLDTSRPSSQTKGKQVSDSSLEGGESILLTIHLPNRQTVTKECSTIQTIGELLHDIVTENSDLLDSDNDDDYMLWEVIPDYAIQRPLRTQEYLKFIQTSWGQVSKRGLAAYLEVGSSETRLSPHSIASLTPRRDLLNRGAGFSGRVQYCKKGLEWSSGWKKGQLDINDGVLRLRKSAKDSRDLRSLTSSEFELYEVNPEIAKAKKLKAITTCIVLRSQQSPHLFVEPSDSMLAIIPSHPNDYSLLKNILHSVRSQTVGRQCNAFKQQAINGNSPTHDSGANLLNIHANAHPQQQQQQQQHKSDEDVPLATSMGKLNIDGDNSIRPTGLLGEQYDKIAQEKVLAHNNTVDHPTFAPNSLLGRGTQDPAESGFGRGLLGRSYTTKSRKGPTMLGRSNTTAARPSQKESKSGFIRHLRP